MKTQTFKLHCTGCGAETRAPCDCGVRFQVIKPAKAAAPAIKKHRARPIDSSNGGTSAAQDNWSKWTS